MVFGTVGGFIATSVFGLAAGSAGATIVGGLIGGGMAFGAQSVLGEYMNRQPARPMGAIQGTIKIGGDIPAEAVYGRAKTKGQRLYYAKYGPGDEFNSEVLVLSNGWCDGLEPYVYFYGKKHNLVELPKIGNEVAHYGVEGYWYDNNPNGDNCFSIRVYDGRPGQQVDQRLVDETADLGRSWKPNSTVAGHTYVVVRMRFDGDADFADNGRPELEFVLRGLRLYDPRKDSTVAGGSGTHRLDDPATWEFGDTGENPALQRLNYQIGLRGLISDRTIIGEGKTLGQIDLSTYFASMNVCDTLKNGKPTYACSLIVNADDDHTEVLKVFDDAMAGYGLNRRGLSGVIAGAPQLPMLEITEADIDVGRPIDYRERKNAFELYNHMSGQFISIEDNWKPASLTPIHVNADVAADGRPRQTGYDLLQITDPDIAQYVLTIRYRQQRLGARYESLPVSKRVGLQVEEGKWITFRGREWLVQGWNLDEDFNFTLTLAETGAGIYDDDDIEPGPIIVPSPPPINPSLLSNVQDFAVEVGIVEGAGGMQAPALRFSWTPPNDATIDYVRFQYGPGTAPPDQPFEDICANAEAGEYVTTKNVEGGHRYVARQTIRTVPDRFKTWGQWVVTADVTDVRFSDILDDSVTAEKIADAAVTADKLMDEAVTSIKLAAEAVTESKLAVGAASERVIAAGAIVSEKLANGAVDQDKVADEAIIASKIAGGAVTELKLASGAVSEAKLAINAVSERVIAAGAVSETKISDGAISTPKLAAGSVIAGKIGAGAVTTDKLAAGSVVAEKISAGAIIGEKIAADAIGADKIVAGAITARELNLVDFSNVVVNGDFSQGSAGWTLNGDNWRIRSEGSPTSPVSYLAQNNIPAGYTGIDRLIQANYFPVSPGDVYYLEFWVSGAAVPDGQLSLRLQIRDQLGEDAVWPAAIDLATPLSGWTKYTGTITVPDTIGARPAAKARAWIEQRYNDPSHAGGTLYLGKIFVRRANNAQLIVDGAITSSKLTTGSVTAGKIATGAVTTDKLEAGSVVASKIAGGTITGDKLQGGTITGDKIAGSTITGDKIVASTITARELVLTDYSNVVVNGDFSQGVAGWNLNGSWSFVPETNAASPVAYFASTTPQANTNSRLLQGNPFAVNAGEEYYMEFWVQGADLGSLEVRGVLRIENGPSTAGGWQRVITQVVSSGTGWTKVTGKAAIPASVQGAPPSKAWAWVEIANVSATGGVLRIGKVFVRRANNAELIVDGAITADKLDVNSLSAITGNVGELVAGVIRSANGKVVFDLDAGRLTMSD